MLTNTILWKNCEQRPPGYKDMRRVIRKMIKARKQKGLAGGLGYKHWQDSYESV